MVAQQPDHLVGHQDHDGAHGGSEGHEIEPEEHQLVGRVRVGGIGTQIALRANAFGMEVIGVDPEDMPMMPFVKNAATRYISPTKTPEYLAAGLPVISTSIRDVVRQYGDAGLVGIADDVGAFADAIDAALATRDDPARQVAADAALDQLSWDSIWTRMAALERAATLAAAAGEVQHAADAR